VLLSIKLRRLNCLILIRSQRSREEYGVHGPPLTVALYDALYVQPNTRCLCVCVYVCVCVWALAALPSPAAMDVVHPGGTERIVTE
jgi:hypothetical protein